MTHRELLEIVEEARKRDEKLVGTLELRLPMDGLIEVLRERLGDKPDVEGAPV